MVKSYTLFKAKTVCFFTFVLTLYLQQKDYFEKFVKMEKSH